MSLKDQRFDPLTEPCGQVWETTEAQKARAVRVVASLARSGEDARLLLDALGLDAAEGKSGGITEVTA